jgi:hypothetical protein
MAAVTIGRYVFVEEPSRLRILDSVGEQATKLILSTLLALGGVAGSVALLLVRGPAGAGWWLLATGIPVVLGIWLLSRVIAKGRTIWTLDRESGEMLHRAKLLRSLSSITHVAVFWVEWPPTSTFGSKRLMHYVGFAPRLAPAPSETKGLWKELRAAFLLGFAPGLGVVEAHGLRKDILAFRNSEDASQAATILVAFLDVGIVKEEV